jgi:hypothetical protein
MSDITAELVKAIVDEDLREFFGLYLSIQSVVLLDTPDRALDLPVAPSAPIVSLTFIDDPGKVAVAVWQVHGTDDMGGLPDMFPSGRPVWIEGVTVLDLSALTNYRSPFEGAAVVRYIDWSSVYAQVGSFPGRQIELELPPPD